MISASPQNLAAVAQAEVITQFGYDSDTLATAASSLTMFDNTNPANRLLAHPDFAAGSLPYPKFFRWAGLRIIPQQREVSTTQGAVATQVADVMALIWTGFLTMEIGNLKNYIIGPLFMFPGGVGVVTRAGNTTAYSVNNGLEFFSSFFRMKHWVGIPSIQPFRLTLTWPTAPTLTATQRLFGVMDGELGREIL